ncbi:hypothetical protein [Hyphomicrobium sp. ghe19]|uniref:hypothetical protein n=1 Tax=Hyphomicrobium sp. ghe19 TaxID=2682968 RepID=UPI001366C484|nr:hypothetical protein HYPP_01473 [Hyphomicrobium sp. ghe19]
MVHSSESLADSTSRSPDFPQFTPGPWSWDSGELVADGGFLVLGAGLAKNGASYVSVKDEDKPIIAAAPDLYEALEALVLTVIGYERINNLAPNPGRKYCWDATERAIAALAKANPPSIGDRDVEPERPAAHMNQIPSSTDLKGE